VESDLVEHLRHAEGNNALEIGEVWNLLGMAAAEIERLCVALSKAEDEKFEYGQERYNDGFGDGGAAARETL
jgi:hypothetical protein